MFMAKSSKWEQLETWSVEIIENSSQQIDYLLRCEKAIETWMFWYKPTSGNAIKQYNPKYLKGSEIKVWVL